MSIPAGWYPDPQQQDQLRYWDGAVWTEHQTPAQASQPAAQEPSGGYSAGSAPQDAGSPHAGPSAGYGAAPAPGTADQTSPYGSFSETESAQAYGGPGYGAQAQNGFGPPTQGADPLAYGGGYGGPGQAPGGKPNRVPLIVGGIIGVVLVVALVLLGVTLISGGDEDPTPTADPTTAEPTADPTTAEPTDDPTTAEPTDDPTDQSSGGTQGAELALGGNVRVNIPEDGTASATLTVDQAQVVRVYTSSDTDPVMSVLDADGNEVAEDDDNEYDSPNGFDASVQVALQPGQYTIELHEWAGEASQVTVAAEAVGEATSIEVGETEFQVTEDGVFVGLVAVQPGTYTLNIVSDDQDPTLEVALPSGETAENDDRNVDAPDQDNIFDPYLEVTVSEAGEMAVLIQEYGGEALSGTLTITQQ